MAKKQLGTAPSAATDTATKGYVDGLGGGGVPGGSTTQVQYNNAGAFGGASNVLIEGSELRLPALASAPTTPAASGVKLYSKSIGARVMPMYIGPDGIELALQSFIGRNRIVWATAASQTTGFTSNGTTISVTGTATSVTPATTSAYTLMNKIEALVTTAAVGTVAGFRGTSQLWCRGGSGVPTEHGGFHMVMRFGLSTGIVSTSAWYAGTRSSTSAPTAVNPSTLLDSLGVGCDSGDTQIQFIFNDASGVGTKVSTGLNRPTVATAYELTLWAPRGGSSVQITLRDLSTMLQYTYDTGVSTNIPASNTLLAPHVYHTSMTTSSVIGCAFSWLYVESDN